MFLSSSINGNNFISYSNQPSIPWAFNYYIRPNSQQACLFHLPSPFIPYNSLLLQQQSFIPFNIEAEAAANTVNLNKNTELLGDSSQRTQKKGHSQRECQRKISTARGMRDRRMRLSLEIGRKFFHLQDMLGFDKASKTVEWLLIKAKAAIKELARDLPHKRQNHCSFSGKTVSSTSNCEGLSEISAINEEQKRNISKGKSSTCVIKERKAGKLPKAAIQPLASRESMREKARARARERTKQKMRNRRPDESKLHAEALNHNSNQLGPWSPFKTAEETGSPNHKPAPSLEADLAGVEDLGSNEQHFSRITEAMVDESLVIMHKWSPSSITDYLHDTRISQEVFNLMENLESPTATRNYSNMDYLSHL